MGPPGGNKNPARYSGDGSGNSYVQPPRSQATSQSRLPHGEQAPNSLQYPSSSQSYRPVPNQNISMPQTTQPAGRTSPYPTEHEELPVDEEQDNVDGRARGHSSRTQVNVDVSYQHRSTQDEVCQSTPDIFTSFIVNRMENDGYDVPPHLASRANTEKLSEVASILQRIGDDMSNNRQLNHLISEIRVTPNTAYKTFVIVAAQIFQDGSINWGRIVTLFYFAYKLALQVVNQLPLIDVIISWVTKFVAERLASWISARGGWTAVREYFGSTTRQLVGVFVAGILLSSLFWWWKR